MAYYYLLSLRPLLYGTVMVWYCFKNICERYGIQVHFKSGKTLKDELVASKDKDQITKRVA